MQRYFDQELEELKKLVMDMSAMAQEAIFESVEALKASDQVKAQAIIDNDVKIDNLELVIDEKCIDLLARYQPVASDLRFIAVAIKINEQLERIADLALDVAQRVLDLADKPLLKELVEIPRLSEIAERMVRDAADAFVKRDVHLAKQVLLSDPEADQLKATVTKELVDDYMMPHAGLADRAVPLLLVARHLERICDHATNIAEDVIYMVQGKVVKHHLEELENVNGRK